MHTKKIDIYIFIYCIYLTTDTKKETCRAKPLEPLSPKQRLLNKSSRKECTSNMTAGYCSNTEPCFQIKREQTQMPLGAVSQAVTSTERAVWGKTDSTITSASVPLQTWSTQHASFVQPERVMYSTTVTLFSQIDRYIQKAMCRCGRRKPAGGTKKVHYSYITLAQMLSSLFFFFANH